MSTLFYPRALRREKLTAVVKAPDHFTMVLKAAFNSTMGVPVKFYVVDHS